MDDYVDEYTPYEYPQQGISGLEFSVNVEFVNPDVRWWYIDPNHAVNLKRNQKYFYLMYVNQEYYDPRRSYLEQTIELILKLYYLGHFFKFDEVRIQSMDYLYNYIKTNIKRIVKCGEIDLYYDVEDTVGLGKYLDIPYRELSKLRHNSVWCIYDKRSYLKATNAIINRNFYLKSRLILNTKPIRLELHMDLHYCKDYLKLEYLDADSATIMVRYKHYAVKSWNLHKQETISRHIPPQLAGVINDLDIAVVEYPYECVLACYDKLMCSHDYLPHRVNMEYMLEHEQEIYEERMKEKIKFEEDKAKGLYDDRDMRHKYAAYGPYIKKSPFKKREQTFCPYNPFFL